MRILACSVVAGCAIPIRIRPTTITVPSTPEAQACWRQCTQITASCVPGCHGEGIGAISAVRQCMDACADLRDQCLRTCPGSTDTAGAAEYHPAGR